jgi:hypothetical protein
LDRFSSYLAADGSASALTESANIDDTREGTLAGKKSPSHFDSPAQLYKVEESDRLVSRIKGRGSLSSENI